MNAIADLYELLTLTLEKVLKIKCFYCECLELVYVGQQ